MGLIERLKTPYRAAMLARAQGRARAARTNKSHPPRALVIPPTGWGSNGDAAMFNAAAAALGRDGLAVDIVLPPGWSSLRGIDRCHDDQGYFFGGWDKGFRHLVGLLGQYDRCVMIGADCLDGAYNPDSIVRRLRLLREAAALMPTRILGSSFNDHPDARCVAALRSLPPSVTICARDPASRERMEAALERPIAQTADLAFLIKPDADDPAARSCIAWIAAQRAAGRRVVGVNLNFMLENANPGYAVAHAPLLDSLLARDVAVLLVPHDRRAHDSDARVTDLMQTATASPSDARVRVLEECDPASTKAVLADLDILVTGRMHAAILAAGVGVPSLAFVYQNKFEGLYQLLGLPMDRCLFTPAELVADPKAVTDRVMTAIDDAATLRTMLAKNLPAVIDKARANFG